MSALTLEQLKSLEVGDWVWIEILEPESVEESFPKKAYFQKSDIVVGENFFPFILNDCEDGLDYQFYGRDWLAYKNKECERKKIYYHATDFENLVSILDTGIEVRNAEGVVYLCEKVEECLRFAKVHGVRDALVCKVMLNEDEVFETFDHSFEFFQCRAFGICRRILTSEIKEYYRYDDI